MNQKMKLALKQMMKPAKTFKRKLKNYFSLNELFYEFCVANGVTVDRFIELFREEWVALRDMFSLYPKVCGKDLCIASWTYGYRLPPLTRRLRLVKKTLFRRKALKLLQNPLMPYLIKEEFNPLLARVYASRVLYVPIELDPLLRRLLRLMAVLEDTGLFRRVPLTAKDVNALKLVREASKEVRFCSDLGVKAVIEGYSGTYVVTLKPAPPEKIPLRYLGYLVKVAKGEVRTVKDLPQTVLRSLRRLGAVTTSGPAVSIAISEVCVRRVIEAYRARVDEVKERLRRLTTRGGLERLVRKYRVVRGVIKTLSELGELSINELVKHSETLHNLECRVLEKLLKKSSLP